MTGFLRFVASVAVSTTLGLETATLVCVPAGLGPNVWIAACVIFGIAWVIPADRIVDKAVDDWKRFGSRPTVPARDGDGQTLLALFAMHDQPVRLFDLVLILNPCPEPPSWLHPVRRWRMMTAWVGRGAELEVEAGRLAQAGLLRCTERARRWVDRSLYEPTGLGWDVAARNVAALMASLTENIAEGGGDA